MINFVDYFQHVDDDIIIRAAERTKQHLDEQQQDWWKCRGKWFIGFEIATSWGDSTRNDLQMWKTLKHLYAVYQRPITTSEIAVRSWYSKSHTRRKLHGLMESGSVTKVGKDGGWIPNNRSDARLVCLFTSAWQTEWDEYDSIVQSEAMLKMARQSDRYARRVMANMITLEQRLISKSITERWIHSHVQLPLPLPVAV